jgi:hypothetical protein
MQKLLNALNKNGKVLINKPRKGLYFTVSKEPCFYSINGYVHDEPININITSEVEMLEFAQSYAL